MKLLLVRHAEAAPRQGDRPDDWRELTAAGRRQARQLGKRLRADGEQWDGILTSPLARAIQTAEALACGLKFKGPLQVAGALIPGNGSWQSYLDAAASVSGAKAIALIGHDPDLSAIASEVLGRRVRLAKGSILALSVDGSGQARELGFLAPAEHDGSTAGP